MKVNTSRFSIVLLGVVLSSLILSTSSIAQTGGEQYRHFTARDGLSNAFVWAMHQDRYGFIWIAGTNGLEKFDGYSFTSYRHDSMNERSVPAGEMRTILEAENGKLWIGTQSALGIFDPVLETTKTVLVPDSIIPVRFVWTLLQEDNGDIWAGTGDGLYRFPKQNFDADTLETSFFQFNEEASDEKTIRSISMGDRDKLWVGTNSGLFIFDRNTQEFSKAGPFEGDVEEILSTPVWKVLTDRNDNLWISTNTGFALWRSGAEFPEPVTTFPGSDIDLSGSLIQSIVEDDEGIIWVGTGSHGAFILNPETMEIHRYRNESGNPNSIPEDDVHYFFKDRDGNAWFGFHFHGISMMHRELWNYTFSRAIEALDAADPVNIVRTVRDDKDGNLWLGTNNGLVYKPSDGSSPKHYTLPPGTSPSSDRENWINGLHITGNRVYAVSVGGVYYIDRTRDNVQRIYFPEEIQEFISIDGDEENLYLGTTSAGMLVVRKADHSFKSYLNPFNDPGDTTQLILDPFLDIEGTVWVAVFEAFTSPFRWDMYRFDPVSGLFEDKHLPAPENLTMVAEPAKSLTQPGVFWAVTSSGLLRQDMINTENRFFLAGDISVTNALNYGLLADRDDNIWFGGVDGIRKYDSVTGNLSFYNPEAVRRPNSLFRPVQLANGDIVYSGFGGYVRFNPYEMLDEPPIEQIHVTEIRAGADIHNTLFHDQERYAFNYSDNNVSISFTALNYKSPNSTRYRYRLSGYQDDWVDVGTQRRVFLANLSPGDYTFQVQASNQSGFYGDSVAETRITILPPWWRTWPAYAFFTFLIGFAVISVDRVQRKRVLARERERTREKELEQAREIEKAYQNLEKAHRNLQAAQRQLVQQEKLASLGQLTAGIAHEIKNPLNFVNNFSDLSVELIEEAREELNDETGNESRQKEGALKILDDIETNLRKIHEHGTRADNIVKSMLLHSRGKSGEKIPTDVNSILDEYVKLAYHGMRAVDKSFNIDIRTDYDEGLPHLDIVPQDVSRAFLNIINNGMYEANKYARSHPDRKPVITVQTRRLAESVEIRIKDNGGGIPDEIKERIFEPFFTTKPTGEGTGLGLSMTYDIIKLHDGILKVDSSVGEFTEFIIELPITNKKGV
jgi:signal transduction histidine kinase/ligand-binding sensor domain-containing protein